MRWVYARGRCYHDAEGRPLRYPGVSIDITARKLDALRQAALARLGDRLKDLSDRSEIIAPPPRSWPDARSISRRVWRRRSGRERPS